MTWSSGAAARVVKFDVDADFTWIPRSPTRSPAWATAACSSRKTLGANIDHWRLYGDAGYFFGPRVSGRIFFLLKDGNGLDFPDDFPTPRTDERWYQHDRMVKHNYMNVGVGLDRGINEKYSLSSATMALTRLF